MFFVFFNMRKGGKYSLWEKWNPTASRSWDFLLSPFLSYKVFSKFLGSSRMIPHVQQPIYLCTERADLFES